MNVNLEMNRFFDRRNREAVDENQMVYDTIMKKLKAKKEIEQVLDVKEIKEIDYQKFRRTFNLFIININKAINSIGNTLVQVPAPTPKLITILFQYMAKLETFSKLSVISLGVGAGT